MLTAWVAADDCAAIAALTDDDGAGGVVFRVRIADGPASLRTVRRTASGSFAHPWEQEVAQYPCDLTVGP